MKMGIRLAPLGERKTLSMYFPGSGTGWDTKHQYANGKSIVLFKLCIVILVPLQS